MPEVATPADALAIAAEAVDVEELRFAAVAERTPGAAVVRGAPGGTAPVVAAVDAEPAWVEVVRAEAWELEVAPSCVQPTVQLAQGSAAVEPVSPVWGAEEVRLGASLRKKKQLVAPARAFAD